ncbi:hypothetical protein ACFLXC_01210 [Chloroflexota bacterium]
MLDHIIIGDNRYYSFASEGLIEEYQVSYLNLKMQGAAESKQSRYPDKPSTTTRELWKT